MKQTENSTKTRIVILGAGFGGVYTLKHLHAHLHKKKNIEITIVNPTNYFLFTPLLHEVATGSLWPENIIEPLRKLFDCCSVNFIHGNVFSVSTKHKKVKTSKGEIQYDYLVIALGSQTNFYNVSGAQEHSFVLKTLSDAVELKNHFIHTFERASHVEDSEEKNTLLHFVIVGGGPTGVELAAEMSEFFYDTFAEFYPKSLMKHVQISLLHRQNSLLNHLPPSLQEKSFEVLKRKKINVHFGIEVKEIGKDYLVTSDGKKSFAHTIIWTAGVAPQSMDFDENIVRDLRERIVVNKYLQIPTHKDIFVLGDMASSQNEAGQVLPMLAQVATDEGKIVSENIINEIDRKPLKPLQYKHTGDLVSLGAWAAVGEIGRFKLWGHFTWWLWRMVYLSKLISFTKKLTVAIDWTIDLFLPRDISEFYNTKK